MSTDTAEESRPTFDALPLSSEVKETLAEIGYQHPTPVQLAVWEPATRGKDAVVQARTGTGKTASFGLPIVDQVVRRSLSKTQVLCLCPTRELALQVMGEIERLGRRKGVKCSAVYGGAGMQRQIDELAEGAHVVVGTPGRVLDHLKRGTFDPGSIRMLVLDEADEMLSMGFERELTAILERLPKDRQTLLFSATLPPEIERMAKTRLRAPEFVTLSSDAVGALTVTHYAYFVTGGDKIGTFLRILEVENPESAVVFCNTKDQTQSVAMALQRAGFDADWLNGDLPQNDREKVMAATREGRLRFLVATDVAARGIDISHLTHVINYDFPDNAESYVHRTGRTGRAGRTGTAIALVEPGDMGALYYLRLTYKIRPVERSLPTAGELKTRAEADLVGWLADAYAGRGGAEDLALARRVLTHETGERILAGLLREFLGARPDTSETAAARRRATTTPAPAAEPGGAPSSGLTAAAPTFASPGYAPGGATPASPGYAPGGAAPASPGYAPGGATPAPKQNGAASAPAATGPRPPAEAATSAPVSSFEGPRGREERASLERGRRDERRGGRDRGRDDRRGRDGGRPQREPSASVQADEPRDGPANVLIEWQPPAEENDDEPILEPKAEGERERERDDEPRAAEAIPEDGAEIFVNLGRRDGVRASDLVRLLQDGGFADRDVRRVRVRDKHTFVTVPKEDLERALTALTGTELAGKRVAAEPSRRTLEAGEGA